MDDNSILGGISSPADLHRLDSRLLPALCAEIRDFLIDNVSKTGGHLASNLGVVEISVGIHKIFNSPADSVIFDVGHQSYVHKILTGRKEGFSTLRMLDGMSGFQRPAESPYDCLVTGHASNSISIALGLARARTLQHSGNEVICVIGDGAMTGGMAYEALNDAGQSGEKLIIIYNDNEMSISHNVGALAQRLSQMRSKPRYFKLKAIVKNFLSRFYSGEQIIKLVSRLKGRIRSAVLKESIFELLGFRYLGPADGNDITSVCAILTEAKAYDGPVVVHLKTVKGKGYYPSENSPTMYHGVSPFDMVLGAGEAVTAKTFSDVMGETLCSLAENDDRVCAVTAAMADGTGLVGFAEDFPARFFDVGIAEGHGAAMSAGLATGGMKPVFAVYSSFLQRGFDQLIHDIAINKNHVVLAVDRAGLVGADGETHQGLFDVPYLMSIPDIAIMAPSSFAELRTAMKKALYSCSGPVAVRYCRGGELGYTGNTFDLPQALLTEGGDITLVSYGIMINTALDAAEILSAQGIKAEAIKINNLRDFNFDIIAESVKKTGRIIILEDAVENGAIGQRIAAQLAQQKIPCEIRLLNMKEQFIPQGTVSQLAARYGIDKTAVTAAAKELLKNDGKEKA